MLQAPSAAEDLPKVSNRHHYHGRALPDPHVYVGRGTPLGNPYHVKNHGSAALVLYRRWLWAQITQRVPDVMAALRAITPDHHLVCSCTCSPPCGERCHQRPCHAEVIVRAWLWARSEGLLEEHA